MPHTLSAGPQNASVRRLRRGALVVVAGLALSAPAALAADEGGLAAGDAPAATSSKASKSSSKRAATRSTPARHSKKTIKAVQRKLRRQPDGVYGKRTRAAVRRFQKRRKLEVDGKLGPETLAALKIKAEQPTESESPVDQPANSGQLLELIADCESGGDPTAVSASGKYRGKFQFLRSTWRSLGGDGDPAEAPEGEQNERAGALLAKEGTKPWPVCGPKAKTKIAGKDS